MAFLWAFRILGVVVVVAVAVFGLFRWFVLFDRGFFFRNLFTFTRGDDEIEIIIELVLINKRKHGFTFSTDGTYPSDNMIFNKIRNQNERAYLISFIEYA